MSSDFHDIEAYLRRQNRRAKEARQESTDSDESSGPIIYRADSAQQARNLRDNDQEGLQTYPSNSSRDSERNANRRGDKRANTSADWHDLSDFEIRKQNETKYSEIRNTFRELKHAPQDKRSSNTAKRASSRTNTGADNRSRSSDRINNGASLRNNGGNSRSNGVNSLNSNTSRSSNTGRSSNGTDSLSNTGRSSRNISARTSSRTSSVEEVQAPRTYSSRNEGLYDSKLHGKKANVKSPELIKVSSKETSSSTSKRASKNNILMIIVFVIFAFFVALLFFLNAQSQVIEVNYANAAIENRTASLKKENAERQERLARRRDLDFIASEAARLGYVTPNPQQIILVNKENEDKVVLFKDDSKSTFNTQDLDMESVYDVVEAYVLESESTSSVEETDDFGQSLEGMEE